jgi:hypothetical protein
MTGSNRVDHILFGARNYHGDGYLPVVAGVDRIHGLATSVEANLAGHVTAKVLLEAHSVNVRRPPVSRTVCDGSFEIVHGNKRHFAG